MNTVEELKQLIQAQFDIDPATIDAEAAFDSYNLDSLTLAELLFAIEDNFHVVVPDEAATSVTNLTGLATLLDGLIATKAA
ncbi:acyl carrier protein [Piscinibacter terrae]|uniref:Acyl carrier protein n=1 Tax=Piscinibacter terrae TaxID=2496871 RepID=A0A3N7HSH5_9BURK|nr:acyl carrier protein [Albitalea terrae]RQP23781.1 acyl carrier protein [Albitalea terrae]